MKKRFLVAAFLLCSFFASGSAGAAEKLTLMLDWFPNVDHLPIYLARERGFFDRAGIDLAIVSPSDTADALKLAAAGKVDLAVSYQPQAVIAAAAGLPVKVVGRLVVHPLTTLLYLKNTGIAGPKDLSGKKIGYTVPGLMDVLLHAFAQINGVENYTPVHVGFSIVPALTSGKVAAVMGPFKTYETVTLDQHGYPAGIFELEKWGIPDYDELIFVCGPKALNTKKDAISAFSAAVQSGIEAARADPGKALSDYFRQLPEADRNTETEAFARTLPYFAVSQSSDLGRWQRFADFSLRHGLIQQAVRVEALFPQGGVSTTRGKAPQG
ncbi:MAG: ABC transporter substrate-binding protein [Desulfobacterales bacterium]